MSGSVFASTSATVVQNTRTDSRKGRWVTKPASLLTAGLDVYLRQDSSAPASGDFLTQSQSIENTWMQTAGFNVTLLEFVWVTFILLESVQFSSCQHCWYWDISIFYHISFASAWVMNWNADCPCQSIQTYYRGALRDKATIGHMGTVYQ